MCELIAMEQKSKWVKLMVDTLSNDRDCWVFLAWFCARARGYDLGIVPHSVFDSSEFELDSGLSHENAKSQARSAIVRGKIKYVSTVILSGGRSSRQVSLFGWRLVDWESRLPDSRVKNRDLVELPMPSFSYYLKSVETITIRDVAEKCIECMSIGGKSTRVLALDAVSISILEGLIREHGGKKVMEGLESCGGAARPAYMLKKILEKSQKSKRRQVPSREEWLKG